MKPTAILCADVHLVEPGTRPACRSDDVYQAGLDKLLAIRGIQDQYDDIPVLCAGDIFHHWRPSPALLAAVIPLMRNWIAVPGQHDLPNHKLENYDRSGLAVLEAAGCVNTLHPDRDFVWVGDEVQIVGFPWGVELGPISKLADHAVALVHHFVYPGSPPFPGADEYGTKAEEVLRKMTGFDLILTGDNHDTFLGCLDDDGAWDEAIPYDGAPLRTFSVLPGAGGMLVNPGPIVRLTATLADHEPSVFLWEAESNTVERVGLPHDPSAVSRDHLEEEAERDSRISEFTSRLQVEGDWDTNLDFRLNLERAIATGRVPDPIRDIVWEIVDQKGA